MIFFSFFFYTEFVLSLTKLFLVANSAEIEIVMGLVYIFSAF